MKNKLIDIHNSLMLSLEMLDDEELFEDEAKGKMLIERVKAKAGIARTIIEVDRLGLEAAKYSIDKNAQISDTFRLSERKPK